VLATTDLENPESIMKGVKKKNREVEALKMTDVKKTLYGD
jgi:hypothetical protein